MAPYCTYNPAILSKLGVLSTKLAPYFTFFSLMLVLTRNVNLLLGLLNVAGHCLPSDILDILPIIFYKFQN
jgi:hypothetical protein